MTPYIASLIVRLRRLFGVDQPAPRIRRRYERTLCGRCGKNVALTSRGVYRHDCHQRGAAS